MFPQVCNPLLLLKIFYLEFEYVNSYLPHENAISQIDTVTHGTDSTIAKVQLTLKDTCL